MVAGDSTATSSILRTVGCAAGALRAAAFGTNFLPDLSGTENISQQHLDILEQDSLIRELAIADMAVWPLRGSSHGGSSNLVDLYLIIVLSETSL